MQGNLELNAITNKVSEKKMDEIISKINFDHIYNLIIIRINDTFFKLEKKNLSAIVLTGKL